MREVRPDFPGAELVGPGLRDLAEGRETIEALIVSIGAPRLRWLGYDVPPTIADAELRLYEVLAEERGDAAHSAHGALVRRLVSFERTSACVRP